MNDGVLGEAAVLKELILLGYTVFTQFDGQSPFDMVAYKDDELYRVSVKSTSVRAENGKYVAQIKRVRINSGKNTIFPFDPDSCDILAVYIIPEDRVVLYDAKTITTKTVLQVAYGAQEYMGCSPHLQCGKQQGSIPWRSTIFISRLNN